MDLDRDKGCYLQRLDVVKIDLPTLRQSVEY